MAEFGTVFDNGMVHLNIKAMKKVIAIIAVMFTISNVCVAQNYEKDFFAFIGNRIQKPATIETVEKRDTAFKVGDYCFVNDDENLVYSITAEQANNTNVYVCDVDTSKEADSIIKTLANKKGCNKNITYTTTKKYNGYSYYVGIKITFKDAK